MIDRWDTEEVAIMTKKPNGEWVLFEKFKALEEENKRLRNFIEYVASIDAAVVSDPDNENPLSMGELQVDAVKALK